jgi:hypothetical protein
MGKWITMYYLCVPTACRPSTESPTPTVYQNDVEPALLIAIGLFKTIHYTKSSCILPCLWQGKKGKVMGIFVSRLCLLGVSFAPFVQMKNRKCEFKVMARQTFDRVNKSWLRCSNQHFHYIVVGAGQVNNLQASLEFRLSRSILNEKGVGRTHSPPPPRSPKPMQPGATR